MPAEWTPISLPPDIKNLGLPMEVASYKTEDDQNILLISLSKSAGYDSSVGNERPFSHALQVALETSSSPLNHVCFDLRLLTYLNAAGFRDLADCLTTLESHSPHPQDVFSPTSRPEISLICNPKTHRVVKIVGFNRFFSNVHVVEPDKTPIEPALDPNHSSARGALQEFNGF